MPIKPNNTIFLILCLVATCAALATFIIKRYLQPARLLSSSSSSSSSSAATSSPSPPDGSHSRGRDIQTETSSSSSAARICPVHEEPQGGAEENQGEEEEELGGRAEWDEGDDLGHPESNSIRIVQFAGDQHLEHNVQGSSSD